MHIKHFFVVDSAKARILAHTTSREAAEAAARLLELPFTAVVDEEVLDLMTGFHRLHQIPGYGFIPESHETRYGRSK